MSNGRIIMKRTALAAILLSLACLTPAYAEEPYVYGAIGQADADLTGTRGLWRHEGQHPYTTDLKDMAFKAGLGMRFESGFFIEAGMVDPGSFNIQSQFTSDGNYNEQTGQCERKCDKLHQLNLTNDMIGGEAVVGYQHEFFDFFRPYAKAGVAGFAHEHSGTFHKYPQNKTTPRPFDSDRNMGQNFDGMVIAVAFGGGVCAPAAKVELCGDVTRYHYIAHTANPLTDGMTVGTAYLKVPLKGWW